MQKYFQTSLLTNLDVKVLLCKESESQHKSRPFRRQEVNYRKERKKLIK